MTSIASAERARAHAGRFGGVAGGGRRRLTGVDGHGQVVDQTVHVRGERKIVEIVHEQVGASTVGRMLRALDETLKALAVAQLKGRAKRN